MAHIPLEGMFKVLILNLYKAPPNGLTDYDFISDSLFRSGEIITMSSEDGKMCTLSKVIK
jgi:hypothetical protein